MILQVSGENTLELQKGPVDLGKVARKVINSCEALVTVGGISLNSEIERETPLVFADERRIEQILYNIFSNSIRHIQSGGVTIRAEEAEKSVNITLILRGSDLDEVQVGNLFSAYETSTYQDGENEKLDITDLSLAIARNSSNCTAAAYPSIPAGIVFSMISVFRYGPGSGSCRKRKSWKWMPLSICSPCLTKSHQTGTLKSLSPERKLKNCRFLKVSWPSMNYTVVPMLSGTDLLSRVKEQPAHLVIIDVKLPDMSGYEVCSEIRKLYSKDELPVILVINKEDVSEKMEGLTSGANDFLTRPYMQEEFLTRVNTILQLSRISTIYFKVCSDGIPKFAWSGKHCGRDPRRSGPARDDDTFRRYTSVYKPV